MQRKVIEERCIIDFDIYTDGSSYAKISIADEMAVREKIKSALQDLIGHRNMVLDIDLKIEGKNKKGQSQL